MINKKESDVQNVRWSDWGWQNKCLHVAHALCRVISALHDGVRAKRL